jgi:hypothetical protein
MSSYSSSDDGGSHYDEPSDYPNVLPNTLGDDTEAERAQQIAREAAEDAALARRIAEEELAIAREEQRLSMHSVSRTRSTSRASGSPHAPHLSARASARLSSRGSARLSSRSRGVRNRNSSRYTDGSGDNSGNSYDDGYDDQYDDGELVVMASPVDVVFDDELVPRSSGVRTMHDELADNRMAQDLLDREIMALEERQVRDNSRDSIDHSLDYMRPRNYTPYFSACAALVCTVVMVSR